MMGHMIERGGECRVSSYVETVVILQMEPSEYSGGMRLLMTVRVTHYSHVLKYQ